MKANQQPTAAPLPPLCLHCRHWQTANGTLGFCCREESPHYSHLRASVHGCEEWQLDVLTAQNSTEGEA
jgi:hypothetical protein